MARGYTVVGDQTVASASDTALTLQSATTIRPDVYAMSFSCLTDELDDQLRWTVQAFITDDGTGTGVTPTPMINAWPASLLTAQSNHTTEPSAFVAGEIMLDFAHNTRSGRDWVAQPGRQIVLSAIATEGIGMTPIHGSSTPAVLVQVWWEE